MKLSDEHVLELKDVGFLYPDGTPGLDRCSLAIPRGGRVALLGANGAGKTTLFLHLNGILRPKSGTVLYGGRPLDYGRQGLHALRSRIGLVFQNPDSHLFSASVREDVSFGPMNLGLHKEIVSARVEESLLAVGMEAFADKPVHNLSYGQKKRVCIAGVLAMRPEVLVLDEPMAGLDMAMQVELVRILDKLHAEGMTVIIATHDMDFAYAWSETICILARGRAVTICPADELPSKIEQLEQYGLAVPHAIRMCELLQEQGFITADLPVPRTCEELVRRLQVQ